MPSPDSLPLCRTSSQSIRNSSMIPFAEQISATGRIAFEGLRKNSNISYRQVFEVHRDLGVCSFVLTNFQT